MRIHFNKQISLTTFKTDQISNLSIAPNNSISLNNNKARHNRIKIAFLDINNSRMPLFKDSIIQPMIWINNTENFQFAILKHHNHNKISKITITLNLTTIQIILIFIIFRIKIMINLWKLVNNNSKIATQIFWIKMFYKLEDWGQRIKYFLKILWLAF